MRTFIAAVTVLSLACLSSSATADDFKDAEKAFKEYGKLMVGGIWTSTDEDGNVKQHTYRWIANKKFIQVRVIKDTFAGAAIIGIDPESKQLTAWWFGDGDLGTGKFTVVMKKIGDNKWSNEGRGKTTQGTSVEFKGTFVLDKDTLTNESTMKADGEEQKSTATWKRKARTSRKKKKKK